MALDGVFLRHIKKELCETLLNARVDKVFQPNRDELILAFRDLDPQAPTHVLIIPKEHIASANEITEENAAVVAHIFTVAKKIAAQEGLENGYRIVNNCGEDGGQTVKHLHFHLLGGRSMKWPPG